MLRLEPQACCCNHLFGVGQVVLISSKNASITEVEATGGELVRAVSPRDSQEQSQNGYQPVVPDIKRLSKSSDCALAMQYGYRMSKVALNMAGRTLAGDLKKDKISVALIHPGVVRTS